MYYIANFKMNLTYQETLAYATEHNDELEELAQDVANIVLCPSHESIALLCKLFDTTPVAIGAQDTSNHTKGSYTGQVSAQSLHQTGCTYCIVGHSERRMFNHEDNDEVAQKVERLLGFDITPIVCVGELSEEFEAGKTRQVLTMQLAPVIASLKALPGSQDKRILLAYEPVWSIGTGKMANTEHLGTMFAWLKEHLRDAPGTWQLLYGGSVNAENAAELKKIEHIDGFLIGKSSISFQNLKKIIK